MYQFYEKNGYFRPLCSGTMTKELSADKVNLLFSYWFKRLHKKAEFLGGTRATLLT